jgi:hypothetical protein
MLRSFANNRAYVVVPLAYSRAVVYSSYHFSFFRARERKKRKYKMQSTVLPQAMSHA